MRLTYSFRAHPYRQVGYAGVMQSRRLWFEADPVVNGINKPLHAAEVAFCLSERIFSPRGTGSVPAPLRPGDEAKLRFKGDRAGRLQRSPNQSLPGS
jgi:hypothetical protein